VTLSLAGCTSLSEYVHNRLKVGPNYGRPTAPVAEHWIESADKRVRSDTGDISQWWTVFDDPVLNGLVQSAYRQNLTLREAGFRVLEARAQRGIAVGELFPQTQFTNGDYARGGVSVNVANGAATPQRWFSQWDYGFGMAWELDFWGRFRRAVESADAELDASIENYDDVLVTLLADVATHYVEIRTLQKRIELARVSVKLFEEILTVPEARFKADAKNRVPYDLAKANLAQAQALVPRLEIARRQAENRLCILLGMPPRDLQEQLGKAPIPTPPVEVAVGIPADLLRRRPDVRRAERQAAAQSARIGIAEADFYPRMAITGTLGGSSQELTSLLAQGSFTGAVSPGFRWDILNYGRIANNVRVQDARFQGLVAQYQQTVLKANGQVEIALVAFLKSQEVAKALATSAEAWRDGTMLLMAQYRGELIDFVPVGYFEQNLLREQDQATQAQGDVALALIDVYRALGGGWQIRLGHGAPATAPGESEVPSPKTDENMPGEAAPVPKP
jgi:NodT family efflux transporter outer membrane factor (OMF) lipoprotein